MIEKIDGRHMIRQTKRLKDKLCNLSLTQSLYITDRQFSILLSYLLIFFVFMDTALHLLVLCNLFIPHTANTSFYRIVDLKIELAE